MERNINLYLNLDACFGSSGSETAPYLLTSGAKKSGRIVESNCSRWPTVFALLARSINERILRLWRIGTSDINSTPPATIASYVPVAISPMPVVMA